ncbi:MAG TPA: sensor histidine kinase, partial [Planctomycetota bacterium]|nr:sensor histidine kinase [Planctomycetota bacterium]
GLQGFAWLPYGAPSILAPRVRIQDLRPARADGLTPGACRWTPARSSPRLGPTAREGWQHTSQGVEPQGVLRFVVSTVGAPPAATLRAAADAVAAAQALLIERKQTRSQAAAWHLGLRSAALVHDLRNRLALISLQQQRFAMEQSARFESSENLEGLRLLEEARAMCAAFVPEVDALALPERCDLRPLLVRAAQNAPSMVRRGGHGVGLRVRCRADVVTFVDPVLLSRVLENLLVNALEASRSGQIVELSAETRGNNVVLTLIDEGVGMDAAGLERAFLAGGGRGTGFGSVSLLAALHDLESELWVDTAPGQGTRAIIHLPAPRSDHALLLVDPDGRRRQATLQRWSAQGRRAIGVPRCSAAIRSMGESTPKALILVRGLSDRRMGDLLTLAARVDCPVSVLQAGGTLRALDSRLVRESGAQAQG